LLRDCNRAMRLVEGASAIFRYEDTFFECVDMVDLISLKLGLSGTPQVSEKIFDRYLTKTVKAFAENLLMRLPASRIVDTGRGKMDPVTQIHDVHIGDGRVGKWRDLPPASREYLTDTFQPFLRRFDYV
jgi:hypothetical protein